MKIHLQQIPDEGRHIEGDEDAALLELREPDIAAESPIHYSLDVGLSEGGLFATGSLSTRFRLRCVRCLDEFSLPVHIPDFACQVELTGPEMVDLTPLAREDILLALPSHPHCDWDGRKECHPARRGESTHAGGDGSESAQNPPALGARPDVWGPLDKLNLKNNQG